jgi:hypothetical protein
MRSRCGVVLWLCSWVWLWALLQVGAAPAPHSGSSSSSSRHTDTKLILRAEGKSGSTFAELVLFEAARRLCTPESSCRIGTATRKRKIEFIINTTSANAASASTAAARTSSTQVVFTGKHLLVSDRRECVHVSALAPAPPCGLSLPFPARLSDAAVAALLACAERCQGEQQPGWGSLYLFRDPRDVVVSRCHHELRSEALPVSEIEACVRDMYGNTLYWVKLRELLVSPLAAPVLCYECLASYDTAARRACYHDLISLVGLPAATPADVEHVMQATALGALKRSPAYAHIAAQYGENKFRVGFAKSYADYGLSLPLLQWMDAAYWALEAAPSRPSPCAAHREARADAAAATATAAAAAATAATATAAAAAAALQCSKKKDGAKERDVEQEIIPGGQL